MLHRVRLERKVLQTIERRRTNWISHILRRNCLLEHIIEGRVERRTAVTGRRKRRRKQLLDDLGETQRYWKFKVEALDRTVLRTQFGKGCEPVVRLIT